jgi:hypothetical protein
MKTLTLFISGFLLLGYLQTKQDKNGQTSEDNIHGSFMLQCPPPPSFTEYANKQNGINKDEDVRDGIDQDWYSKALENISQEEYNITYSEELGTFQSPNRANNIRFIYHKDGFTAKTRTNKIPKFDVNDKTLKEEEKEYETVDEWEVKLRIKNYELGIKNSEIQAAGNKAFIEEDKIRIDYTNTKDGMRQDFIIKQKPAGEGKLRLNLSAETKLKMIVGADALMFKNDKGEEKMKYSALKVWDANGKELRAYFEKNNYELRIKNYELRSKSKINDPKSKNKKIPNSKFSILNSFSIVVNDEDAVYPVTIDPLSNAINWSAEGNQASAYFGNCVATAGDVNGDGYSDVIVGAYAYDNGQTDEGGAFVYLGSATGLNSSPSWTGEGNQANAQYGILVSTAGDVNGDGYSDIIVGARFYDNGQTDEGRAYLYHGSAGGLSATANWTAESDQANAYFGNAASTAGDVNGDGYSDVIVGAFLYDNGQTDEGKVYVYHGSASGLSAAANWTNESNQAEAYYGYFASTAGDVNGDGYSDVIIGAPWYDNGQTDEGRAYVYHGSASGLSASANWSAEINQTGAIFGNSVSTAGDVNGDGYSDVIVGARYYDVFNAPDEGAAYVFHGSASGLSASANWTNESNQTNAQFGVSVSTAGDVNGDGYSDVVIGSFMYDNGQTDEGKAFVYFGSSSGLSIYSNWAAESDQANAQYGCSVATAGDVNGDGFSDVIIGAHTFDNGQTDEGRAYVYHGFAAGLAAGGSYIGNGQIYSYMGVSVSTAGDVNGDGYSDIIVGAPLYDNGQANEGMTYVFNGSREGTSLPARWIAECDQAGSQFGFSVSTAGDVNGDGYSDVIVGALYYDNGQTDEGGAFVYHGSASGLSATANWTAEGNQILAAYGFSVSTAGDVNGDGYSDVIVGAPYYYNGQYEEGRAFVYYGSASGLSITSNWTAESDQGSARFGNAVSTAGDVNGDGYSDVIVGSPWYDNGQTNEGKVYVYHGSATGLSATANWTAESNQASAQFGYSVSTAGDVNGDGYSDVIIGADLYDNGQTDEGSAFVYHGSASGLPATVNWTAESNQASAHFGVSVSTAGDVNGDGYSDVILGASYYDNGQTDEGKVYVYHGSASGLSASPSWTAESDQPGEQFGSSVCTAGDVNGDGYSDVIVGAPYADYYSTNDGKVYWYYGNGANTFTQRYYFEPGVQQYKPGTNNIIASGGLSGTDGQARLNIYGRSPFGRADGKIVYEYKVNGVPFSGSPITNSTSSSGFGTAFDLGTSGVQLNNDISGLLSDKVYKWRARVQYSSVNNPYQKYGPWKYYNNYVPVPLGNFRPSIRILPNLHLNLSMLIQGFYNPTSNTTVQDTVKVYLRNFSSPYAIIDSAKGYLNSSGQAILTFSNAFNGLDYYLNLKHRNSIETWSKTPQMFINNSLSYDFTTAAAKAYGDNMLPVDLSPIEFAIYGGDVNQDGTIDATDVSMIDNDAFYFVGGHVLTDLTGDSFVDGTDFAIADNNAANFVSVVRP